MLKAILLALGAVAVAAHKVRTPGHQYPHKAHHNNPHPSHLSRRSRRSSSKRSRLVLLLLKPCNSRTVPTGWHGGSVGTGQPKHSPTFYEYNYCRPPTTAALRAATPEPCRPQRARAYFSQYLSTQRCTGAEVP